jgi:oxalate decarboxylase
MSDLSFRNNVPDPVLSWKELPTFKFELEKSTGKVMGKSFGKEATVKQLPTQTRDALA